MNTPAESNVKDHGGEAASLTAADLDRLAALHEAATPGPWKAGSCWINAPRECWITHDDGSVSNTLVWGGALAEPTRESETMRLIASMHAALPSLLALARRGLEAANRTALDDAADEINALCGRATWEYPGQLVRDVRTLKDRAESAESKLAAALAEVERLRAGLQDFAEWGLRCDTSPTYAGSRDERDVHRFYQRYIAAQEKHVKERARDWLRPAAEAQAAQAQGGEGRA